MSINYLHRIWEIENWGTPRRRHNKTISIHLIVSRWLWISGRAAKTQFYLAFLISNLSFRKEAKTAKKPHNWVSNQQWERLAERNSRAYCPLIMFTLKGKSIILSILGKLKKCNSAQTFWCEVAWTPSKHNETSGLACDNAVMCLHITWHYQHKVSIEQ